MLFNQINQINFFGRKKTLFRLSIDLFIYDNTLINEKKHQVIHYTLLCARTYFCRLYYYSSIGIQTKTEKTYFYVTFKMWWDVIWLNMLWFNMLRFDVIWYDMAGYDMILCTMLWHTVGSTTERKKSPLNSKYLQWSTTNQKHWWQKSGIFMLQSSPI